MNNNRKRKAYTIDMNNKAISSSFVKNRQTRLYHLFHFYTTELFCYDYWCWLPLALNILNVPTVKAFCPPTSNNAVFLGFIYFILSFHLYFKLTNFHFGLIQKRFTGRNKAIYFGLKKLNKNIMRQWRWKWVGDIFWVVISTSAGVSRTSLSC